MTTSFDAEIFMQSCENCRYYMNDKCHKNPPVYTQNERGRWPTVEPDEWCGEWVLHPEESLAP
jgi:hypothetical protein